MYSKFNSREDYVTLLEGLGHLTTELREEMWQKRKRKRKKEKEMRFNHGPANVPSHLFPNMATRSRRATSANALSPLTLRSHLRSEPLLLEEAKPSSISNQKATITGQPNVANKQSEPAVINHEKATPSAKARPATSDIGMPVRDKLK